MSTQYNPYGSPQGFGMETGPSSGRRRKADLGKRFLGFLIDGMLNAVVFVPGYGLMIAGAVGSDPNAPPEPGPLFFAGVGLLALGGIALAVTQIYLLATRSQTVGKLAMKTQIVDHETWRPANFVKSFVLRALVNGLIAGIPCVGGIYAIADICFIFSEERRCLHDQLAGTSVADIS